MKQSAFGFNRISLFYLDIILYPLYSLANRLIHRESIQVRIINAPFVEEINVFKINRNAIFSRLKIKTKLNLTLE